MKFTSIALAIAATHLIFLAFFFFKPPVHYFAVTCVSTVLVWGSAFAIRRVKRRVVIPLAFVVQILVQQAAYRTWMPEVGAGWPLAQFIALQYVVVLSISRPDADR